MTWRTDMRVLNLYAGLGGNRKLWKGCEVVAVESHEKIAEVYQRLHPADTVIVGDAHEYLRQNFRDWDYIKRYCSYSIFTRATGWWRMLNPSMIF
jgi:site-specific DNA-cytosine methylase